MAKKYKKIKNNLKIYADIIEDSAMIQIKTLMAQSAFQNEKVRIMPDCHSGAGCVIGFTSTMTDKIIPNVIGVDIGCGMRVAELKNITIDFAALDNFIKADIPSGSAVRDDIDEGAEQLVDSLLCKNKLKNVDRLKKSMGSLGGGNHFIEIDSGEGGMYLVVHSGSRNVGLQVAEYYQRLAVNKTKNNSAELKSAVNRTIASLKAQGAFEEISYAIEKVRLGYQKKLNVPDELCYLMGEDMQNYLHDMRICQRFAELNRQKIVNDILNFLGVKSCKVWESVHNYIDDKNIIRKGAIAAYKDRRVIIPMNMRDGCIIGVGKGRASWNYSAPHGAGRIMSRSDAFKRLSAEEFRKQMNGIYTTTATYETIDESPMAYKPIENILKFLEETVEIKYIIKPVYNFKAVEKREDYNRKKKILKNKI